jgi:hypothetical protein
VTAVTKITRKKATVNVLKEGSSIVGNSKEGRFKLITRRCKIVQSSSRPSASLPLPNYSVMVMATP